MAGWRDDRTSDLVGQLVSGEFDGPVMVTGALVVAEVVNADGEHRLIVKCDTQAPAWTLLGMAHTAANDLADALVHIEDGD